MLLQDVDSLKPAKGLWDLKGEMSEMERINLVYTKLAHSTCDGGQKPAELKIITPTDPYEYLAVGAGQDSELVQPVGARRMDPLPDDGNIVLVEAFGNTKKDAGNNACHSALTKLFCADPSQMVLRPCHGATAWMQSLAG